MNVDRAGMLPFISKAVNIIFHNPKSIFWTGKAIDILFDGIPIDCSSTDFNSKATCSVFGSGDVKSIQKTDDPDVYKFSLFGGVSKC